MERCMMLHIALHNLEICFLMHNSSSFNVRRRYLYSQRLQRLQTTLLLNYHNLKVRWLPSSPEFLTALYPLTLERFINSSLRHCRIIPPLSRPLKARIFATVWTIYESVSERRSLNNAELIKSWHSTEAISMCCLKASERKIFLEPTSFRMFIPMRMNEKKRDFQLNSPERKFLSTILTWKGAQRLNFNFQFFPGNLMTVKWCRRVLLYSRECWD